MKKILYISYDGMTDQLGQSQVIPYLSQLSKMGYQITILSVEKKQKLMKLGGQIDGMLKNSGIKWVHLLFSSRPPLLSKMYDQWNLQSTAIRLHKENKYDLIHCRSYVAADAGLVLNKKFGVPYLFDMRGFWVDERVDGGLWDQSKPFYKWLYNRYKKKEKEYFRQSAHVISLTEKGKAELEMNYELPAENITVIPCCADLEHFDYTKISDEQKRDLRKDLNLEDNVPVLSYLGSLGGWYLGDQMLDFFVTLKKHFPKAVFLIITHDDGRAILEKAASKGIQAEDIRIKPAGRNEVPVFLSISQWNIFFIKDAYSKKASSPTKQGEVMAMGVPVICNDIGDTGKIVTDSGCGWMLPSLDNAGYEYICEKLNCVQPSAQKIRNAAFQYYDLTVGVSRYASVYDQLIP